MLALYKEGQRADRAVAGEEIQLILDSTPCYAEAGGQVADYALVAGAEVSIDVREVFKPVEGLIVHKGRISQGMVRENDVVKVAVDLSLIHISCLPLWRDCGPCHPWIKRMNLLPVVNVMFVNPILHVNCRGENRRKE